MFIDLSVELWWMYGCSFFSVLVAKLDVARSGSGDLWLAGLAEVHLTKWLDLIYGCH